MKSSTTQPASSDFLIGDGEMATLIRSKNWSGTSLGPIGHWPQSLRTTVSLCLASNFPINIIWGPENLQIYNDGYRVICGEAHPRALGEGYDVTWASAWPAIGEPFEQALAGETSFLENQRMFLTRNGYLEETFFTFSLSQIRDESGDIGGLFHPVTETTTTMLAERRTRALRDLTASLSRAEDLASLRRLTVETFASFAFDVPFLLFYEREDDATGYRLSGQHGIPPGRSASPMRIDVEDACVWPVSEAIADSRIVEIDGISTLFEGGDCGPYPEAPEHAFVLPLSVPGVELAPVVLIAGASPRLPLDDAYRGFYELVAAAVAAALSTVRAREDERRRSEAFAAIDRAKTQFFTNVSHEFRTPLTLMLGPLRESLAHSESLPEDERERVRLAHRNGLRLLKLVNSLLDFSRIEAGRVLASYEPVDLGALTADLASNFRSACERADLDLVVEVAPLGGPVHVDRDMWEKVILNLLSNAFKFTLEGGITVTVGPGPDGTHAQVTVADTGLGISPEELPRLFERFHRVEGARGRSFEGSGIGLALVQELVRLQGGEITVESTPGRGSAFTVALPLRRDGLPLNRASTGMGMVSTATDANAFVEEALRWLPDEIAPNAGAPGAEDAPDVIVSHRLNGHILLADDNADMRGYVHRLLTQQGLSVEVVPDGETALVEARRRLPDLILTDVMMPRLDGFGLLKAVRADAALRDTPVILLSARAGEEARVEGLDAGADDYLTKPFSARELVARVSVNLSQARDRREAALRASENRLSALVRASSEVLYSMNPDWSEMRQLTGGGFLADTDTANPDWLDHYILPEDHTAITAAIREAVRTKGIFHLEHRVRRADGSLGWTLSRAVPLLDEAGEITEWFGTAADVTARHEAETALQRLNLTLEREIADRTRERDEIWRVSQDMLMVIGTDGVIRSVNPAWTRTLGYEPVELVGRRFDVFVDPEDYGRTVMALEQATRNVVPRFDNRWRHKDGSWRNLSWTAAPSDDRIYCVGRDITLDRQREKELEEAQDALRQAQKMEAVGQLTGGVAHDFNNLLTVIKSSTDLLKRPDLPEERRQRYIGAISDTVDRAAKLTGQLLAFARRQALRPEVFDVGADVTALTDMVGTLAGSRIQIVVQVPEEPCFINVDPSQFDTALVNMAVNARDAMNGEGRLTITVHPVSGIPQIRSHSPVTGDFIAICIEDTGCGIPPDKIEHIFEPFFTTKGVGQGTGLGLSQVFGFAKQSGGEVRVQSTVGRGTMFVLYLPRAAAVAPASEFEPEALVDGHGTRVLVVEDNIEVGTFATQTLAELGYKTVWKQNADDALAELATSANGFDVVFSDVIMPGMNGIELAKEIRHRHRGLPVVLTSGYSHVLAQDGTSGFELLHKPYSVEQLSRILRKAGTGKRRTRLPAS